MPSLNWHPLMLVGVAVQTCMNNRVRISVETILPYKISRFFFCCGRIPVGEVPLLEVQGFMFSTKKVER